MTMFADARIPVVFGSLQDAAPEDALLIEGDLPTGGHHPVARFDLTTGAGHMAGCACCMRRGAAAAALAGIFVARARGTVPFFRRVVAVTCDVKSGAVLRD